MHGFTLMSNSNIWTNSTPLQDIKVKNISNVELQGHSRSKSNVWLDSPQTVSHERIRVAYDLNAPLYEI